MKRVKRDGQLDLKADAVVPKILGRSKTKKLTATMKRRALKVRKSERPLLPESD